MSLLPSSVNCPSSENILLADLLHALTQTDTIPSSSEQNDLRSSPTIPFKKLDYDFFSHMNFMVEDSFSESPVTSSSPGSNVEDRLALCRCTDCSESCHDCSSNHMDSCNKEHTIAPIGNISPGIIKNTLNEIPMNFQCDIHLETLRYFCETCHKIVCQECTLWEHKDHKHLPLQEAIEIGKSKLQKSLEFGKTGTKYIRSSIDKAVAISRTIEKDALQISIKVRKTMKTLISMIEERERQLLEKLNDMRQLKSNELSEQMQGLRNALAGLVQTNEYISKLIDSDNFEILLAQNKCIAQIEYYAGVYSNLQPKDEGLLFVPPSFDLVMEIKKLGDITYAVCNTSVKPTTVNNNSTLNTLSVQPSIFNDVQRKKSQIFPAKVSSIPPHVSIFPNPSNNPTNSNIRKSIGQCIPGSIKPIYAKSNQTQIPNSPQITFGTEGHENGQLSRPWGLCVNREGNIIIADRRNNRVQIFNPDGTFILKFGTKGTAAGEFDLPAGITTDPQGRIVVVDKDNHRVQIFTPIGGFILMFGTYGKGCGQFRYPWDVAINSEGQIVVTDSRNYRIQLFNSEGVFIKMLMFDGTNHSRLLKGLTTPRGVCFTHKGDIIISDFENHRLLLIDSSLTNILGTKGSEGLAIGEFSRPSGIICDDEGKIIVADSKNHRVIAFSSSLDFLWALEVKGIGPGDNDRPTDIGLTQQGNLVVVVEGLPDSKEGSTVGKTFIQIF